MPLDVYELVEQPIPNFEKIYYTFMHRRAFRYVLESIFADLDSYDELDYRADIHDLDKCLYLALGGEKHEASAYHRANASHHMETNTSPSEYDLIEAVIDYECAGYTKADKPLNAYDTVIQWSKPHAGELIDVMKEFDMAHSYENTPNDSDWCSFNGSYDVTEDEVLRELDWFCQQEPQWAQDIVDAVENS